MKELLKETKMICKKLPSAKPGRWRDFWNDRAKRNLENLYCEIGEYEETEDACRCVCDYRAAAIAQHRICVLRRAVSQLEMAMR